MANTAWTVNWTASVRIQGFVWLVLEFVFVSRAGLVPGVTKVSFNHSLFAKARDESLNPCLLMSAASSS